MDGLLVLLPLTPPGASALYGVRAVGAAAPAHAGPVEAVPLALLPRASRRTEVIACVPAQALSWHRVSLPAGLARKGPRLLSALQGLLEDRLLQDLQQVHLALQPQWESGQSVWVAACDKAWLQAHLRALQEAGLSVQRIVPQMTPPASGRQWQALGEPASGTLWCGDAERGVCGWPLQAAASLPAAWLENNTLYAPAALAAWAQTHTRCTVVLSDSAQDAARMLQNDWDLAQFDLQSDTASRRWQALRRAAEVGLRSPQWRPARWGVVALLLTQLLGLQAWAWVTRQQWQAEQARWTQILQETFPKVALVVDAPLQMEREMERLRQGSGQLGPQDFESQLRALGGALPDQVASPNRLSYQDGQLQWPSLPLEPTQQQAFEQALQQQGYRLITQQGQSRLQAQEARP